MPVSLLRERLASAIGVLVPVLVVVGCVQAERRGPMLDATSKGAGTKVNADERFLMDGQVVTRAVFEGTLATLIVGSAPTSSANWEDAEGASGGTEATYEAHNVETGERFLLIVAESAGGAHRTRQLNRAPGELLRRQIEQGLWGREILVVRRDFTAWIDFEPTEPHTSAGPKFHAEAALPEALRQTVLEAAAVFDEPGASDLEPSRPGIPDEALIDLLVYRDGRRYRLRLWDDDPMWARDRRARTVARAMEAISSFLHPKNNPP
ncbi:MAG: hypothetical protein IPK13_09175 [Deltaproteobacteria bacterium]|nr:hypothetical protein [Deltaproteobacteria bacterium]